MNTVSKDVAGEFCALCNWAYECWLTHQRLFDENNRKEKTIEKAADFTRRLWRITQEYFLLQICKLHDPAVQGNSKNVTINYIEKYGDWGSDIKTIQDIVSRLNILFEKIKPARDKIIAHNDHKTLMEKATLGEFPEGDDKEYFLALQELANEVSKKWLGGLYPFDDLAGADVDEFLDILEKAEKTRHDFLLRKRYEQT